MSDDQIAALPAAQFNALLSLWGRSGYTWAVWRTMLLAPTPLCDYVGVRNFHGMFVGVEVDGYTHS